MRQRRLIVMGVLGGIVLVIAVFWLRAEPHYHGKSLSYWLRGFESDRMEVRVQSADALRHVGTNALPQLIVRLHEPAVHHEPAWRRELRSLLSKLSIVKAQVSRPPDRRVQALAALDALGPRAKDAIPALEELLHQKPPDPRALFVLADIGDEAIPALNHALTNDEKVIRFGARVSLNMLQTRSAVVTPKIGEDAEFMRRTCEFNNRIVRAAFEDHRAQHPDQFSADGMPLPSLPPDASRLAAPNTNQVRSLMPEQHSIAE